MRFDAFFFESQTQHLPEMIIFCFAIYIVGIHAIVYWMVLIPMSVYQVYNSNSFNYTVRISAVLTLYHLDFLGVASALNAVIDDQVGFIAIVD